MNPPTQEDKLTFKEVASFLKPYLQQVFSKWTPGPDTILKPPALWAVILEVTTVKRNKLWAVWENSEEHKECPEGTKTTVKKDVGAE